jgi:hypothetical protein
VSLQSSHSSPTLSPRHMLPRSTYHRCTCSCYRCCRRRREKQSDDGCFDNSTTFHRTQLLVVSCHPSCSSGSGVTWIAPPSPTCIISRPRTIMADDLLPIVVVAEIFSEHSCMEKQLLALSFLLAPMAWSGRARLCQIMLVFCIYLSSLVDHAGRSRWW